MWTTFSMEEEGKNSTKSIPSEPQNLPIVRTRLNLKGSSQTPFSLWHEQEMVIIINNGQEEYRSFQRLSSWHHQAGRKSGRLVEVSWVRAHTSSTRVHRKHQTTGSCHRGNQS